FRAHLDRPRTRHDVDGEVNQWLPPPRMTRRTMMAATLWTLVSLGCLSRRRAADSIVPVPAGLDSIGLAQWVDRQRAACKGNLTVFLDEGGGTRDYDSAAGRRTATFRTTLVGVQC